MRVFRIICLAILVTAKKTNSSSNGSNSLLEMSQTLWSKLLKGGPTKIGILDPLTVPIVKVDQSEGNTSYRIILRGLEIVGLNSSSLESVHVARGRLKTNLSEHEAGYVSYTDQRELDTIRYRFHTVTKESKNPESQNRRIHDLEIFDDSTILNEEQNEESKNNDSSRNNENYRTSSRHDTDRGRFAARGSTPTSKYDEDRHEIGMHDESSKIQDDRSRYYSRSENLRKKSDDLETNDRGSQWRDFTTDSESSRFSNDRQTSRNSERVRVVYPEGQRQLPIVDRRTYDQRSTSDVSTGCPGICEYVGTRGYSTSTNDRRDEGSNDRRKDDAGFSASMDFKTRRAQVKFGGNRDDSDNSSNERNRYANLPTVANKRVTIYERKIDEIGARDDDRRHDDGKKMADEGLEKKTGYVDIVYADDREHKMRRFGNFEVESGRDTTVYSFDDVMRDLRDNKRFIIHNFTEGEALTKKNDAVRTASETRRIKDLVRYAREFQEMQGYYEQGMQLIYHYGNRDDGKNSGVKDGRRTKRDHLNDDTDEDDIMHVIMKIRVPMLRVNAGYVLMGKVGKQVLRGNGLLSGNFTDVIGDFTLELKKIDDDTMVVRAARARLSAKNKHITLQGMDEEGPVKEILTHGLMAAEAVAAMLADDLATKALTEKTADSIIYRMYKNLPTKN